METHRAFAKWLEGHELRGEEKSALVVGCARWPLTPGHVESFVSQGLSVEDRDLGDGHERGGARYTTTFRR
jgi:hypothetical protein